MKNRVVFIIIALTLLSLGCGHRRLGKDEAIENTPDSLSVRIKIDTFGSIIKFQYFSDSNGPDSVKSYYRDNNSLEYVQYYAKITAERKITYPFDIRHRAYYKDGKVQVLEFYKEVPAKGDTLALYFYNDGNIEQLIVNVKDSICYPQLWTTFHPNGVIMRQGIMDHYKVELVPFGLWYKYDTIGTIIETAFYHNDEPEKAYIISSLYKNGVIESEKIYTNFVLYENNPIELSSIP